jgi:hypothetical protein
MKAGIATRRDSSGKSATIPVTGKELKLPPDELRSLVGDGNAKISVGMDLKESDFGTGFSVFVNVTLTCNQDMETLWLAHGLAEKLATELCSESYAAAKKVFNETGT